MGTRRAGAGFDGGLSAGGTITGNLAVTGTVTVGTGLTVTAGGATVSAGGVQATGNSNVTGDLTVTGVLGGGTMQSGNTVLTGTLNVNGACDFDSTVNVDGAVTCISSLETRGRLIGKPTIQNITAVGNTISPSAPWVILNANGIYTLTSTPTITVSGVQDGTRLILMGITNGTTIQDESVLAGSKLRLQGSANKGIGVNDVIELIFDSSTGFWRHLVPLAALA